MINFYVYKTLAFYTVTWQDCSDSADEFVSEESLNEAVYNFMGYWGYSKYLC